MNTLAHAVALTHLVADVLRGAAAADIARRLLRLAIATGVPANVLASYLSEDGKRRAEIVADLAQAAKFGGRT